MNDKLEELISLLNDLWGKCDLPTHVVSDTVHYLKQLRDIFDEMEVMEEFEDEVWIKVSKDTLFNNQPYIFNPMTGNTESFCSPRSLEIASNLAKK